MSILVEIAGRADVSVEGVVRVLTREPVSAAVKERVLAVLDQLDPEQTRVLERFALVSVHDVVPLDPGSVHAPVDPPPVDTGPDPEPWPEPPSTASEQVADANGNRPHEPAPHEPAPPPEAEEGVAIVERAAEDEGDASEQLPAATPSEETLLTARVGALLEELVSAMTELRRESRSDRQERLDDVAMLVELMSTGWQGVDRRLARIESVVARMETASPRPAPPIPQPAAVTPVIPASERAPAVEAAPVEAVPVEAASEEKRGWPPFVTTLLFLASLVVVLVALDLIPSRAEMPSFAPVSDETPTGPSASSTTSPGTPAQAPRTGTPTTTTARVTPTVTSPEPTTTPKEEETQATTGAAEPEPPVRIEPPRTTTAPAPQQTTPPATSSSTGFQPARTFVWPATAGTEFYSVRFLRAGQPFYAARVPEPRITIPKRIVFTPGAYRWVVRPETGLGSLGAPIIDSAFSVAKP